MSKKKIGLLFGSFNPVHIGHTAIAGYLSEFTDLDQVWFVISPHNPLKDKESLLKVNHRLSMLKIAIEEQPKLKITDIELKLPTPSYTIHTLTALSEKYPDYNFVPIIGSDNLKSFNKWKNFEQILTHYGLLVYPRPGVESSEEMKHPNIKYVNKAPLMEISSSFIRKAVKNGKEIGYFMHPKVHEYMREMHFYER